MGLSRVSVSAWVFEYLTQELLESTTTQVPVSLWSKTTAYDGGSIYTVATWTLSCLEGWLKYLCNNSLS